MAPANDGGGEATRAERLAAALRDNLRRRKAQARATADRARNADPTDPAPKAES